MPTSQTTRMIDNEVTLFQKTDRFNHANDRVGINLYRRYDRPCF